MAEHAQEIATTAREFLRRVVRFRAHLDRTGRGLSHAVDAYNRAVGSWERRLQPFESRLAELGIDLPEGDAGAPEPVDERPRSAGV